MSFLLDTNALSEPGKPSPNAGFMAWYRDQRSADIHLSVVSVGELRRGIALLADGRRRRAAQALCANIVHRFASQILPIDTAVAEVWGDLSASLKRAGRIVGAPDELIAATALVHGLVLVSRNQRHFEACGCQVLRPWSD